LALPAMLLAEHAASCVLVRQDANECVLSLFVVAEAMRSVSTVKSGPECSGVRGQHPARLLGWRRTRCSTREAAATSHAIARLRTQEHEELDTHHKFDVLLDKIR
jgi:hypothetical protein